MDNADIASVYEQRLIEHAINVKKEDHSAFVTGYCLNCGERLDAPRRWCDADCHDDWDRRERRLKCQIIIA